MIVHESTDRAGEEVGAGPAGSAPPLVVPPVEQVLPTNPSSGSTIAASVGGPSRGWFPSLARGRGYRRIRADPKHLDGRTAADGHRPPFAMDRHGTHVCPLM